MPTLEVNQFLARRRCIACQPQPDVRLYHSEVFLPTTAKSEAAKLVYSRLEWSQHAKLELCYDEAGPLPAHVVPKCFFGVAWELIELETTNGNPTKYVFRRNVINDRDLIIVLRPIDSSSALVVTCWTNRKTDNHKTLDRSKYETQ